MRPVPPVVAPEPLTAPEAQAIFYDLADNGRIPFNFAAMGCDYRAWQMRAVLQKQGLAPQLAWAVESGQALYHMTPGGDLHSWWFHVAVALPVITEKGTAEMCVFDPAIFDGPVRLTQWAAQIQAKPQYFGLHDFDDESVHDMPHPAVAVRARMRRLDQETVYERTNEIFRQCKEAFATPRRVYPSHVRAAAEKVLGAPFIRSGKSWQVDMGAGVPAPIMTPPPGSSMGVRR